MAKGSTTCPECGGEKARTGELCHSCRRTHRLALQPRYGRWTVVRELVPQPPAYVRKALVRCDCGTESTVFVRHLRSGLSQSCGCVGGNYVHGQGGPNVRTAEYRAWVRMNQRCSNPKHPEYRDNGAKGIKVCKAWRSFTTFLRDVGPRPEGMVLLRQDSGGDYKPGNCRWGTRSEHQRLIQPRGPRVTPIVTPKRP